MIKIYYLESGSKHLGWNTVFKEIVEKLSKKHQIKLVSRKGIISKPRDYLLVDEFKSTIRDCELVIYDKKNDILKAISWCESCEVGDGEGQGLLSIFKDRNNEKDIFLVAQQSFWNYNYVDRTVNINKGYKFKVNATPFYTFESPISHDYFFEQRKNIPHTKLIDKLFFLSTTRREDPFELRKLNLCSESQGILPIQDYLDIATKYKIGLAISSLAELCYREIEYMAIGLPMMRLEYITPTNPQLIPDYHYIAVDREKYGLHGSKSIPQWSTDYDRAGGKKYVDAYRDRFLEVKDDNEFLNFISRNAREYYENYCSPKTRADYLLTLLNL